VSDDILVPLSLTPFSEAKLVVAEQQARAFNAPLVLLHVLPPGALDPDAVSAAEANARAYLDAAVARLRAAGLAARGLVRFGAPADTILDEARAHRARMIILGSSNRPRLPRAFLGSVADAVVREAAGPVLLVRPTADLAGPALLSLNPPAVLAPRALGRRTIDLVRVVGSATRSHELGPDFRPPHPTPADEQRFQAILAALARGDDLPPVELYKLGFGYYVRDGHHRVAAARRLGASELEATVTELVSLADAEAEAAFVARETFEARTGLTRVGATRPATYATLAAAIDAYGAELGIDDVAEAARRWYAEVFRPLRRQVRSLALAHRFPGERPADLIARLAEWRNAEVARTGLVPTWADALERFPSESEVSRPGV
jgi:nucleotide-binding universal stress UspA family protein